MVYVSPDVRHLYMSYKISVRARDPHRDFPSIGTFSGSTKTPVMAVMSASSLDPSMGFVGRQETMVQSAIALKGQMSLTGRPLSHLNPAQTTMPK